MTITRFRLFAEGIPEDFISDSDQTAVAIPTDQMTTQRALARRFRVAVFDLGLDGIVPSSWVVPTQDGLAFKSLTVRQADRLVSALEDLAVGRDPDQATPGTDQLSFFVAGQP